ncbi:Site-specific DNA-cytosine methylase [Nostoc sphaeroides CCNUC1]|uniref:Site-specific DNA-cytosine methylase (Plasmid) n=1 Tax=Nostoc sphaeroides CCNUC1 TaxID=2653204 RepID=A0A5P8WDS3_9NOSO|nr:Site-specific DNA-cytosine methylase [Nostoc sphaeroides CCNUC1]
MFGVFCGLMESGRSPTNEWQVRPLTKLDPDIQPEAWEQAVESLYIIDTALNRVQLRLCNWLEMNKTK